MTMNLPSGMAWSEARQKDEVISRPVDGELRIDSTNIMVTHLLSYSQMGPRMSVYILVGFMRHALIAI